MKFFEHIMRLGGRFGWMEWVAVSGLLLAVAALIASRLAPSPEPLCWSLLAPGVLLAAGAVSGSPSSTSVLLVAGLTAGVASCSLVDPGRVHAGWDSVVLVLRMLAVLAWLGAVLIQFPRSIQRAFLSGFIVFHFVGIISAALSVPPSPWLIQKLYEHVYHRYLSFLHLTNAYRFYSPEFGPATLLWFRIEYESDDGLRRSRWVRIPDFDEQQVPRRPNGEAVWPPVQYTRRLSLSDGLYYETGGFTPELVEARVRAGQRRGIPLHPHMRLTAQFAPLTESAWPKMREYIRHVARSSSHPERPDLGIDSIKVYRGIHFTMEPSGILNGWEPSDPSLIAAFFLGAFDEHGNDVPYVERSPEGMLIRGRDPFRFWVIPILKRDRSGKIIDSSQKRIPGERYEIHDYTLGHGELMVDRP